MVEIKKIGVMSVAKIMAVLYAFIGLIIGSIFTIFSVIGLAIASQEASGIIAIIFGFGSIIMLPLFYGAMGFFGGAVTAWMYNLIASWIGGIEIETEK